MKGYIPGIDEATCTLGLLLVFVLILLPACLKVSQLSSLRNISLNSDADTCAQFLITVWPGVAGCFHMSFAC